MMRSVDAPQWAEVGRGQLRRRSEHRLVAGVAGGLADYAGVRPIWFRVGFVVFTVLGGVGVLLYALLWWLIPRLDLTDSAAQRFARHFPNAPSWMGVALLGAGAVLLANQFGLWRMNVVLAFLLIGVGIVLFRRDAERAATTAGESGRETAPSPAPTTQLDQASAPPFAAGEPTVPLPAVRRPRREPNPLGWMTFGLALLVVALVAILDNLGAFDLRPAAYPSLGLLVLGAGLLVGTFLGRARWLVLPGLLLVPLALASSLIRVPLEGGYGDLFVRPQHLSQLAAAYHRVAGGIFFDLTPLQGDRSRITLWASTGFGEVYVLVPFDAHVLARGAVGAGQVSIGRFSNSGVDVSMRQRWEPKLGDGPTVVLDLEASFGSVKVYREGPTRRDRRELEGEAT